MEYIEVQYTQNRPVFVDDVDNGMTNKILRVGTGTHIITLGEPHDYSPGQQQVYVANTSSLQPMVLKFVEA